jgi:hypothetical protein
MAQQTTIITTDLNRLHLWMIQQQECFGTAAEQLDSNAIGPVCSGKFHLDLC